MTSRYLRFWKKVKASSLTPYIIIIVLTFIIAWLWMRPNEKIVNVSSTNLILVNRIQAMGKMQLVKMSVKDVLEFKIEVEGPSPDLESLMIVSGEIAGCIDLAKITKDNISEKDSVITVVLPYPEICYTKIDTKSTKMHAINKIPILTDLLVDQQKLTQLMYVKAENYMNNDSLRNMVINETKTNADIMLKPLLENISNKQVVLSFGEKKIKG